MRAARCRATHQPRTHGLGARESAVKVQTARADAETHGAQKIGSVTVASVLGGIRLGRQSGAVTGRQVDVCLPR